MSRESELIHVAARPGDFPEPGDPEIIFMGRSNCGKSSLINALTGRKKLARTSNTPGRTRQVFFYAVTPSLVFVDPPGYGYARVSKKERSSWRGLLDSYLDDRKVLRGACILSDVRRKPGQEELDLIALLRPRRIPTLVVLTKGDKPRSNERRKLVKQWKEEPGMPPDGVLLTAARTGLGIEDLWNWINSVSSL